MKIKELRKQLEERLARVKQGHRELEIQEGEIKLALSWLNEPTKPRPKAPVVK